MRIPAPTDHAIAFLRVVLPVVLLLAIWQMAIQLLRPPAFLFPSPLDVLSVFVEKPAYLAGNALLTLLEMVLGLTAGALAGIVVALLLARHGFAERLLLPIIVATQTLPVFAIAPLLVIWFGFGMASKVVMAMLIIFFPVASTFHDGLRRTPRHWIDLGQSWGASAGQQMRLIRLPAAMPSLMSGLKVAATVAPIGAVVGEWAGAAGGLGFVMLQANARTQTDMVFAALVILALSAWLLRQAVILIADRLVPWAGESETFQ